VENEFTIKKLLIVIVIMIVLLICVSFGISSLVKDFGATDVKLSKKDISEAAITYSSDTQDDLWKDTDESEVFCVTVGELVNRGLLEKNSSFDDGVTSSDFVMVKRNKASFEIEEAMVTEEGSENYKFCKEMLPEVKYITTFHRGVNASGIGEDDSEVITKECTAYGNESCVIMSPDIKAGNGYTVLGWHVNMDANESIFNVNTEMLVDSNEQYYAIVRANTVTIKYNVSDGGIGYSSNSSGLWNKSSDGIVFFNGNTLTTTTLYGGKLDSSGLEDYDNPNRMFISRTGYYALAGEEWTCISGCTGTYSQSKVYSAEDFCNAATRDCEVVLGVNWKRASYIVEYNANGGSGAPNSQSKEVGSYIYISTSIPVRSGYTFKCWNTKADGSGTNYNPGSFYSEEKSLTLYAQWVSSATTYKITYNANGGEGAPSVQTKTLGVNMALSTSIPTRNGYNFVGWNTKSDGSGTNYSAGEVYKEDRNITLYAKWTSKSTATYTVSYIGNGGSGAPASQIKESGSYLYISTTVPTRNGYTFKCWNSEVDGSGTNYNPGGIYSANRDIVLYAQWTIIPSSVTYTITYNANGGSGAPSSQIKIKDIPIYLSDVIPTKKNYTFAGWNTSANGNGMSYNAGQYYNGNMNLKLYAMWKPNTENTVVSHNHNTKAVGNTLRIIEKTKLSCGHYHTSALYKYCSVCGRAVYLIDSDDMYACPCSSSYSVVFNDSVVGNFTTYKSWLGGVVSGYYSLEKASTMTKDCSEH